MFRLAAAAALSIPLAVWAAPPRAEGRIETDEGRTEILGRPVRVGERVDLPEGWFRVEEAGREDGDVGSFTVVPAESFGGTAATSVDAVAEAGDPGPAGKGPPDCRAERSAYIAELWRQSGIDVSSPGAIIEGLEGNRGGPQAGFYWFALATDPFRPLAWSSALRERAEALVRCVHGG